MTDEALVAATAREARRQRAAFMPVRAAATERVIAAYRDEPFSWARANCIRLAHSLAVALGHEVPPVPRFATLAGAKRALAKQGVDSVSALLDLYFERWPSPAFARVGDLVSLPGGSDQGLDAVAVADGQGNVFCWHEATGYRRLEVIKFTAAHAKAAWRL